MYYIYYELFFLCAHVLLSLVLGIFIGGVCYLLSIKSVEYDLGSAYECGFEPFEESHRPFIISFYLIGLLFVLFDIEIIFMMPWCFVSFMTFWSSWFILAFFFECLLVGFFFEWNRGAISLVLR